MKGGTVEIYAILFKNCTERKQALSAQYITLTHVTTPVLMKLWPHVSLNGSSKLREASQAHNRGTDMAEPTQALQRLLAPL